MMINKRLIETVKESKKYIVKNVAYQWYGLMANIVMMGMIAYMLDCLFEGNISMPEVYGIFVGAIGVLIVRFYCAVRAGEMSYLSSKTVKLTLRDMIYRKVLSLGGTYKKGVQTSEVVQVAVEGVDQLETYFGAYLPQFYYAMLAPMTLFVIMSFVNLPCAIILLICVPMIPVAIAAVQTWAKKLLSKYWGKYTALGDSFLENLQGLTTLKIYQADEARHKKMNEEAEEFRKITMKVLTMQLNSITIMDVIAYGGAGLGMIMALTQFSEGNVSLGGCLFIILLSADFFIPMRMLGSFFHIAMNGMAASDKIFRLIDLEEEQEACLNKIEENENAISIRGLSFAYEEDREILHDIFMEFGKGKMTAIVGESGSGKSTIASLLMRREGSYKDSVYVGFQSYLFKGTVRDNLLMGKSDATDAQMMEILGRVKLADFLAQENGLDTKLQEKASNLSGGQRQRLALARALLKDCEVYIFDEATSNIDVESENDIMELIHEIAKEKTVILISHRLANVVAANRIYVLDKGRIVQQGTHEELLAHGGHYLQMWNGQQTLENFGKEAGNEK